MALIFAQVPLAFIEVTNVQIAPEMVGSVIPAAVRKAFASASAQPLLAYQ
jgi:hypothetical protein